MKPYEKQLYQLSVKIIDEATAYAKAQAVNQVAPRVYEIRPELIIKSIQDFFIAAELKSICGT